MALEEYGTRGIWNSRNMALEDKAFEEYGTRGIWHSRNMALKEYGTRGI